MTKREFMEELSAALSKGRRGEAITGLLADFNEHFDEALQAGKSEEEICEMLGEPSEIAAAYLDEADIGGTPSKDTGIFISLFDMNLHCEAYDGDDFHTEVRSGTGVVEDDIVSVSRTGNSLQVIEVREEEFFARLFRAFKFRTIHVRIPRRFNGAVTVKMRSGNIRMDGLAVSEDVKTELVSGNVNITSVSTEGILTVSSRSGNVTLENCAGELAAESRSGNVSVRAHKGSVRKAVTVSGNVRVETDNIMKDCTIETRSGNINASIETLRGNMTLNCHSGNITFKLHELGGNITGKTISGNITGHLGCDTRAVFLLQSSNIRNPFCSAPLPPADVPVVNLTTRSGLVRIKEL